MTTAVAELPVAPPTKKWMIWTGRVVSAIPVLMLAMSAAMKLGHAPNMVQMWGEKYGFPPGTLTPIGVLELVVTVLYVVPRTAALGAILVACYLAGATTAHVRIGDPGFVVTVTLGVLAWLGLWLRDARVRAILPLR